jgi:arylsulfatase
VTKPGTVIKTPVIATDLTAMALAAAGVATPTNADGKDLRSLLTNPEVGPLHETLYWRVGKSGALRSGKWKLFKGGPRWELYDLEADPSEKREVSASHKELTKTLIERWETWSKQQAEPLWR